MIVLRRSIQTVSLAVFIVLLFHVAWPYGPAFSTDLFASKEWIPAEIFLMIDPLVGISTSIAARQAGIALAVAAGVLCLSLFVPRGFCSHLCPLGTTIDVFDATIDKLAKRLRITRRGPWVHLKYITYSRACWPPRPSGLSRQASSLRSPR